MTPAELLAQFRDEADDTATPYLWSDELVFSYIAAAEDMWCRLTDGISDATTNAVTKIAVVPDTEWYDTHPSIKLLRAAYREDDGRTVAIVNHEDMPGLGMRFDGAKGAVRALIWGVEDNKVRAWPVPTETVNIRLTVFRRLLTPTDEDGQVPIPSQYHPDLLWYVKHLAYLKQDVETFDRNKADTNFELFTAACARATREQRMKRHKTRIVRYGGL